MQLPKIIQVPSDSWPQLISRRNRDATAKKGVDCMAYSTHCESYKNRDAFTLQAEVDCLLSHGDLKNFFVIALQFL